MVEPHQLIQFCDPMGNVIKFAFLMIKPSTSSKVLPFLCQLCYCSTDKGPSTPSANSLNLQSLVEFTVS